MSQHWAWLIVVVVLAAAWIVQIGAFASQPLLQEYVSPVFSYSVTGLGSIASIVLLLPVIAAGVLAVRAWRERAEPYSTVPAPQALLGL